MSKVLSHEEITGYGRGGFISPIRVLSPEAAGEARQSGAKVEQTVKEIYAYPADVVKLAADAIRPAR
ncbi:MAG TPA: hypothetical protein VEU06_07875 [Micropepsaceae bacterium]|nr:hypothetical protein [Micropepsaceae bacterium]